MLHIDTSEGARWMRWASAEPREASACDRGRMSFFGGHPFGMSKLQASNWLPAAKEDPQQKFKPQRVQLFVLDPGWMWTEAEADGNDPAAEDAAATQRRCAAEHLWIWLIKEQAEAAQVRQVREGSIGVRGVVFNYLETWFQKHWLDLNGQKQFCHPLI